LTHKKGRSPGPSVMRVLLIRVTFQSARAAVSASARTIVGSRPRRLRPPDRAARAPRLQPRRREPAEDLEGVVKHRTREPSRYSPRRPLSGNGTALPESAFPPMRAANNRRSYCDAYDTRDSCRGSSSETRAHPRAGLVGCSCDSQDDTRRACEVGQPACSARGQMDAGRARSKRFSPQEPTRAREALARGVIARSSRAAAPVSRSNGSSSPRAWRLRPRCCLIHPMPTDEAALIA
jgi:hypothetical protein